MRRIPRPNPFDVQRFPSSSFPAVMTGHLTMDFGAWCLQCEEWAKGINHRLVTASPELFPRKIYRRTKGQGRTVHGPEAHPPIHGARRLSCQSPFFIRLRLSPRCMPADASLIDMIGCCLLRVSPESRQGPIEVGRLRSPEECRR